MTVWVPTVEGGVYKPAVETVPTIEFPPTMPSTSHVMPVPVVPETVALNCCFCFSVSGARRGLMFTVIAANDGVRLHIASRKGSLRSAHRRVIGPQAEGICSVGCTLLAKVVRLLL